jgi:hypothetical protein
LFTAPRSPVYSKEKKQMKPLLYLATLSALAFLMVISIQCPPLAFFAVPAAMLLIALALGV